jgi:radical SAM superfamily enzyme YgiQ (UPF0313 family)
MASSGLIHMSVSTPSVAVKSRKRRLLLIEPYPDDSPYRFTDRERRALWFPKLSLPVIAAYTPEHWDVTFIDESVEPVDFNLDVDLVGISAQMTCYAPRAYQLAKRFRARGIKTVIGGTHVSYCAEEAIQYADTIMIGESEGMWPQVVADFEAGRMQRFYKMEQFPNLDDYRHPRVDLLQQDAYMTSSCIQTTRGCHFECEFCSVSPFNGKNSRRRPVAHVVAEIQRIKERRRSQIMDKMLSGPYGQRFVASLKVFSGIEDGTIFAFVDDLHNSSRSYCKELWTALKPLKIKWGAQCTLFLGDEPEMVKLAAESGCVSMFVGLESIVEESIDETNKPFNRVAQYEREIKCFHDHGVMLNPGVIFGFDHDDEAVFARTVEFLIKNNLELAYFNIMTPLPGTPLFERMKAAGRIFDQNWANYDGKHVVFWPKRMSPETLQDGFFWANHQFFGYPSIFRRLFYTRQRIPARLAMNLAFRHLVKRTAPKGSLSPLSQVIQNLHVKLPAFATENLIPNALHAIKEKAAGAAQQIDRFLQIKVKRADIERSGTATGEAAPAVVQSGLQLDLEGTLDELSAKELRKRLLQAVRNAKLEIVVNFEHLRHATPQAVHALLDGEYLQSLKVHASVKFINLKQAFQTALDRLASPSAAWRDELIG